MSRTRFSSERIESLRADEIFVFGSNRQGWHCGGAAAYARQRFGAVWGEGIGRTGQCYAIPTMDGSVEKIRPYVEEFIVYAEAHPELTFSGHGNWMWNRRLHGNTDCTFVLRSTRHA